MSTDSYSFTDADGDKILATAVPGERLVIQINPSDDEVEFGDEPGGRTVEIPADMVEEVLLGIARAGANVIEQQPDWDTSLNRAD